MSVSLRFVFNALAALLLGGILTWIGLTAWRGPARTAPEESSGARLTAQLYEPEGGPAESCVVNLWQRTGDGRKQTQSGQSGRCDGGRLEWHDLPPGDYQVVAAVSGATLFERDVVLAEGDDVDLGDVTLAPGAIIEVSVSLAGQPVPTAVVVTEGRREITNSEGRARFVGTPVGDVSVTATFEDRSATVVIETRRSEQSARTLSLGTTPLRGVLGIRFEVGKTGVVVREVLAAGPSRGRIEVGDVLVEANGKALAGLDQAAVEDWLDGPAGRVDQLVLRRAEARVEVAIVRGDLLELLAGEKKKRSPSRGSAP